MCSGFSSGPSAFRARHAGLALLLAVALAGCDKVPLVAPSNSTITLTSGARTLATGGTTTLTAMVAEQNGSVVQNGTTVHFTTTLGTVTPADAQTTNGVATATFNAGDSSGVAEIRAISGTNGGGTSTTPTTGTTTTTSGSNVIQIMIGAAAVKTINVTASPNADGTYAITAGVFDTNGNRLTGVPVAFSATAGTISASSATTDSNGEAHVQLTTSQQTDVTATVGTTTGKVTVTPATAVSLVVSPNPGTAGQAVTLTVTPATNTTAQVTVDWGDGTIDNLGFVSAARAVAHVYSSAGTYTIKATSTANGQTAPSSITEVVNPKPAISVTVSASNGSPAHNVPVTFTATVSGDSTASVASYHWVITKGGGTDFDVTTTGNTLTETFADAGVRTITVTVTTTDGRTGSGQTQVSVS